MQCFHTFLWTTPWIQAILPLCHTTHPLSHTTHPLGHTTHPLSHTTHPLSHTTDPLSNTTLLLSHATLLLSHTTLLLSHTTLPLSHTTHLCLTIIQDNYNSVDSDSSQSSQIKTSEKLLIEKNNNDIFQNPLTVEDQIETAIVNWSLDNSNVHRSTIFSLLSHLNAFFPGLPLTAQTY